MKWDALDISGSIPRNMSHAYSLNLHDDMIVLFWNSYGKMNASFLDFNNFQWNELAFIGDTCDFRYGACFTDNQEK